MKILGKVTARKHRNSVMIIFGSKYSIEFNKEYYVSNDEDGSILLIPKVEDFFNFTKNINNFPTTNIDESNLIEEE